MASLETNGIIEYLKTKGVPYRVVAVTGTYVSATNPCSPHVPTSYHCRPGTAGSGFDGKGLAVDLAYTSPTVDSPQLLAIFAAFQPVETRLAELIYAGAPYNIKDGRHVAPYATSSHHNHVHVSVEKGTIFALTPTPPPTTAVKPMFDPPLQIVAALDHPGGGVWLLGQDGGVFALAGAPFYGSAAGQPAFVGRKAARLDLRDDGGYNIVATSGEVYQFASK